MMKNWIVAREKVLAGRCIQRGSRKKRRTREKPTKAGDSEKGKFRLSQKGTTRGVQKGETRLVRAQAAKRDAQGDRRGG